MQKPKHLVRVRHVADPGVPGRVQKAVPEACEGEDDDKNWVRWVYGKDYIGDQMAAGSEDGDSSLAKLHVDCIIQDGGQGVANEGRQEDERDDSIGEVVIGFELVTEAQPYST